MTADQIALLSKSYSGHWNPHYVASKLKTDPLYESVYEELSNTDAPLLDLGCGLGLLAFYLRESGLKFPIHGLDYDAPKIEEARIVADRRKLSSLRFDHHDARQGLPSHQGNVTILDILQFFRPNELEKLLQTAADRVAPGHKLVIRSGLRDASWRFKITVAGDLLAKASFWMKAAPTHYPQAEDFERILSPLGSLRITPLWGATPFNNHLIVLEKEA